LLFGREVRGPRKQLKESWLDEENQGSLLDQVMQLHQRMRRAGEMARDNLKVAQTKMKAWYDRKACKRSCKRIIGIRDTTRLIPILCDAIWHEKCPGSFSKNGKPDSGWATWL